MIKSKAANEKETAGLSQFKIDTGRFSLIFIILSLILWSASLLQSRLTFGFLGLFNSYSVTYYVSLGFITLAFFLLLLSREKKTPLLLISLILVITMIWVSPILIGDNPVFSSVIYRDIANINYIMQNGHLNPSHLVYHSWPGMFIFESNFIQIAGASSISQGFILFSTWLLQLLMLWPLYIFFSHTIENHRLRWLAIWLFYLANWTAQIYLEPQGLAFFWLIILLAFLAGKWKKQEPLNSGDIIVVILIFGAMAVTHLLTSVVAFLSLAVFSLRGTLRRNILITAFMILSGWLLYGAYYQLHNQLGSLLTRAFNLDALLSQVTTPLGTPSPSHMAVNEIRIIFSGIFIGLGLLGLFISFRRREKSDFLNLGLLVASFLVLFSVLYGTEQLMRFYLFALVPLAYFGVKIFNFRLGKYAVGIILLLMLPFSIIPQFGNLATDYFPQSEVAYTKFMRTFSVSPSYLFGGINLLILNEHYTQLSNMAIKNGEITLLNPASPNGVQYIHIGNTDQASEIFNNNDPEFISALKNSLISSNYCLIYQNTTGDIYFKD